MKHRLMTVCSILCLAVMLCLPAAFAADGPQPENRPQGDALALREWSPEELEALQQGLSGRAREWPGHGLPDAEHIQLPQALALSEQILQQRLGMTGDEIATMAVLPYFITESGFVNVDGAPVDLPAPYWQMNYSEYTVYLNAVTGELLALPDLSDSNG